MRNMLGSRLGEPRKLPLGERGWIVFRICGHDSGRNALHGANPLLRKPGREKGWKRAGQVEARWNNSPCGWIVLRARRRVRQTVFTRLDRLELINVGHEPPSCTWSNKSCAAKTGGLHPRRWTGRRRSSGEATPSNGTSGWCNLRNGIGW